MFIVTEVSCLTSTNSYIMKKQYSASIHCIKFSILVFLSITQLELYAQDLSEIKKLIREDIPEVHTGGLGLDVAVYGNLVLVGAPNGGVRPNNSGIAILFEFDDSVDTYTEIKRFYRNDGNDYDYFGESVDFENDFIFIGAPGADDYGNDSGRVYIYSRNTGGSGNWGLLKTLKGSDTNQYDQFGESIQIDGDLVLIGSPDRDFDVPGAAYLFSRNIGGSNNWGEIKKIVPAVTTDIKSFGQSVDLNNGLAIIGAVQPFSTQLGSAYIFSENEGGLGNWGEVRKLNASDGDGGDNYAMSVSISGDFAIVGAPRHDLPLDNSGGAYIYERHNGGSNNWGELKKINFSNVVRWDYMGQSVLMRNDLAFIGTWGAEKVYALQKDEGGLNNWGESQLIMGQDQNNTFGRSIDYNGEDLIIGAPYDDLNGSGSAFIFDYNPNNNLWEQEISLYDFNGAVSDNLGESVAIHGDFAVLGMPYADFNGEEDSGAALIFQRNAGGLQNWKLVKTLIASDPGERDHFGKSVSIDKDIIIIGADQNRLSVYAKGSAYIFSKNYGGINNWGEVKKLDPVEFTLGFGTDVDIEENIAVVGSRSIVPDFHEKGAVYVYEKDNGGIDNWGLSKIIEASDAQDDDRFGGQIDLCGNRMAISTLRYANEKIYILDRNEGGIDNWGEIKIINSPISNNIGYGRAIAFKDDNLAVGAPNDGQVDGGQVFMYGQNEGGSNNWGLIKSITSSSVVTFGNFGQSIAINNNLMVVGTPEDWLGGAVILQKDLGGLNNWGELTTLKSMYSSVNTYMGGSTAIDYGPTILLGARWDNYNGSNSGAAHIFSADNSCMTLYQDDFEADAGIWQTIGADAYRVNNPNSPDGNYSMFLRDGSVGIAAIVSPVLNIPTGSFYYLSFDYKSIGMDSGESFSLEISLDDGLSYVTLKEWVVSSAFTNNIRNTDLVQIPNTVGGTVRLRFRCLASADDDQIFLDNIHIENCSIDCSPSYVQIDNMPVLQSVAVQKTIESNGIVIEDSDVQFSAGDYIDLNESFSVELGAVFHAFMSPCY